ncbi:MAG: hypothetical protein J3R72DRAFT_436080 [Linnemannia gamsii]|nr:MAG: hypothetical protein J3R72DRAFT_436080 [Linnemannia gamsii]
MMYENPFPRILIRKDSMRSYRNSHAGLLRLVQVLLRSLPTAGNTTDLLRAAYITDTMNPRYQAPLPELMSTPYYSFVTTVDFERFFLSNCCIFNKNTLTARESFDDYLDRCGLITWYLQQDIIGPEKYLDREDIITLSVARDLRRDLAWALCTNAERIQRLSIPLSDMSCYLTIVDRFKVLSDVTFVLDRDVLLDERQTSELSGLDQEALTRLQTERVRHLEEMILFVQKHCQLFPSMLSTGQCVKSDAAVEECPQEYQHRFLLALPPLTNPRVIDDRNCTQFITHLQETDLSSAHSIGSVLKIMVALWISSSQRVHFCIVAVLSQASICRRQARTPSNGLWRSASNTLLGPWTLDTRALSILFGKVAPGIVKLIMSSRGHHVDEWVTLSSCYLHELDEANLLVLTLPRCCRMPG